MKNGTKMSAESRLKMSLAKKDKPSPHRGKKRSEETKHKISEKLKGKPGTWIGRKHTEESKKRMSEVHKAIGGHIPSFTGHKHTADARIRMSEKHRGNKYSLGHKTPPEVRAKISASLIGNQRRTGIFHSEGTKQKMRRPNNYGEKMGHPRKIEYGLGWGRIAVNIRARDKYICQKCYTGEFRYCRVPDVHHIIPFYDCVAAGLYPHHPHNLISLCRKCHRWAENHLALSMPLFFNMTTRM